ncbi:MAG TPA: UDP-2,3-diacylglucosamine diphosphatase [Flavipsychrobacter sp.]|jgi:UDP-2,3-diacylglucosamine hydrolase|nr:UDP-2,3-diacylglucosamine diphosphatase [Flavipsychrobacter sp.]
MQLPANKKIYFASDFHLGIPDKAATIEREKRLCAWLDEIQKEAAILYLVGDIFDAWFEYKNVVPKGFTRFLGKLATLRDQGLVIEAFTGNHDLWMRGYFQEELDIPVHHAPIFRTFNNKKFVIAHGDGLGPGDKGYKLMKKVLTSTLAQWLYRRIHPDTGVGIASWLSKKGPKHVSGQEDKFLGEQEWLVQYARSILQNEPVDYFIFGHRHIAQEYPLSNTSKYINLGDWLKYDSYAVFDGYDLQLHYYKKL